MLKPEVNMEGMWYVMVLLASGSEMAFSWSRFRFYVIRGFVLDTVSYQRVLEDSVIMTGADG